MYNTNRNRMPFCRFARPWIAGLLASCFSISLLYGQGSIRLLPDITYDEFLIELSFRKIGNDGTELVYIDNFFKDTIPADSVTYVANQVQFDAAGNMLPPVQTSLKTRVVLGKNLYNRDGFLFQAYRQSDTVLRIQKTGPSNSLIWQRDVQTAGAVLEDPGRILEGENGAVIVLSSIRRVGFPAEEGRLVYRRLDAGGNLLVEQEFPQRIRHTQEFQTIRQPGENACYVSVTEQFASGTIQQGIWKIDANGQLAWITHTVQNETLLLVQGNRLAVQPHDSIAVFDTSGALIFKRQLFESSAAVQNAITGRHPLFTADGGIVIPVSVINWSEGRDFYYLQKWTADGTLLWQRDYSFIRDRIGFSIGVEEDNGDLIWIGGWTHPALGYKTCRVRMDANGIIFDQRLEGTVRLDANDDCEPDSSEAGAASYLVQVEQDSISYLTTTDSTGVYVFPQVNAGPFTLNVTPLSDVWAPCDDPLSATMPDSTDFTLYIDQSVSPLANCPDMRVEIGAPFLRRCFPNVYTVRYCNLGSVAAEDARVDILLPPYLDFTEASVPVEVSGDTLRFQLGTAGINVCDQFTFTVVPNCDSVVLGQTLCVEAWVFPDTVCATEPGWNGGLLQLAGYCEGDSVGFYLKNVGNGPTTQGLDFIVIEDHVITRQGELPALAPGAEYAEWVAASGNTYRLMAMQEPNAPAGASNPSIALEGCNGANSLQHVLAFPNAGGPSNQQIFCRETVGAYDPNDKQAFPAGVGDEHYIEPDTWMDYLIRFQNTGTDTAFTVVVMDTLPAHLDPSTLRPGVASHDYNWVLLDSRVLAFRFDNIALPDSNVNEPASHGFVRFRVNQRPGLPDGTLIENSAGIYFDFNEPVITNTVFHTVGRNYLSTVSIHNPPAQVSSAFEVYPNPAEGSFSILFDPKKQPNGRLALFDVLGRLKWTGVVSGISTEIQRNQLPPGMYWLRWESISGEVETIKVVWQ